MGRFVTGGGRCVGRANGAAAPAKPYPCATGCRAVLSCPRENCGCVYWFRCAKGEVPATAPADFHMLGGSLFLAYIKMSLTTASQLNFRPSANLGLSPLLPNTCAGAVSGTSNPDGQCILGGQLVGGVCRAEPPIFYQTMVPYSTGNVASTNYAMLDKIWLRGNNTALTSARMNRRA